MLNFEAHTEKERCEMLKAINKSCLEDLYANIPQQVRIKNLELKAPLNEMELVQEIKSLSKKNNTDYISFLGGGAYNHFIPACVSQIAQRFEFNTAYTPYQAEISQGTLQAIYEFQSMICNLTNMDVSNASMYDAATACAEAILMACRITGRNKALYCKRINPQYKEVIKTYCAASNIELSEDLTDIDNSIACVIVQTPDYSGTIHDIKTLKSRIVDSKTMLICCCDALSLSVLEPPDCDIMVGSIQSLGIPVSFGGPYAAYFACKDKYKRQIPGRVVGRTIDTKGQQAFCLTLQTREQHIRREKATSNICSNQALIALQSLVYMTTLGKKGVKQAALLSVTNAHKLAKELTEAGFEIANKNFFNEFILKVDNADKFLEKLKNNHILGGIKINDNRILICATEINNDDDIKRYISAIK